MAEPRWCHICSGTGIGFDGDECLCKIGKFEAQQKPETLPLYATPSQVRELLGMAEKPEPKPMTAHFEPIKHDSNGLEWDEHGRLVGYIAVAPDDHAEMVRKSDLYNDLKAVIERLSYELEDLKKRFV